MQAEILLAYQYRRGPHIFGILRRGCGHHHEMAAVGGRSSQPLNGCQRGRHQSHNVQRLQAKFSQMRETAVFKWVHPEDIKVVPPGLF